MTNYDLRLAIETALTEAINESIRYENVLDDYDADTIAIIEQVISDLADAQRVAMQLPYGE